MLDTLQKWFSSIPEMVKFRGREYAFAGRVMLVGWVNSGKNFVIKSNVRGSRRHPYEVMLCISAQGSARGSARGSNQEMVEAFCDCPAFNGHCKHVAAVIIALMHKAASEPSAFATSPQIEEPSISYEVQSWLQRLAPVSSTQEFLPSRATQQDLAVFILRDLAYPQYQLVIEMAVRRVKKDGCLGAIVGRSCSFDQLIQAPSPTFVHAMGDEDRAAIQIYSQQRLTRSPQSMPLLEHMVRTGRTFWIADQNKLLPKPLSWEEPLQGELGWVPCNGEQSVLRLQASNREARCFILMEQKGFYIDPTSCTCGHLHLPANGVQLRQLLENAPRVDNRSLPLLQQRLAQKLPEVPIREKQFVQLPMTSPIPFLTFDVGTDPLSYRERFTCSLALSYGDHSVPYRASRASCQIVSDDIIYHLQRNLSEEAKIIQVLYNFGWELAESESSLLIYRDPLATYTSAVDSCLVLIEKMEPAGWRFAFAKRFPIQKVTKPTDWYAELSEVSHDWFDLEVGHRIDGKRVNLVPYLQTFLSQLASAGEQQALWREKTPEQLAEILVYLPLPDGEVMALPASRIQALLHAFLGFLNPAEGNQRVRIPRWQSASLAQLEEELSQGGLAGKLEWQAPERYKQLRREWNNLQSASRTIEPPQGLQCTLRPYQLEGLRWLQFLRQSHLAGILADDMGLGKTVQALAHILMEKENGRMTKPALVVAPTTLMSNWIIEAHRFAPALRVLLLRGQERKKRFDQLAEHDLILTTYPLLTRDQTVLLSQEFHLLILDEAQNVKNAQTQAHKVLRELRATHRLCLTGTPMENHLGELWSLFHLILPGFLGSAKQFQQLFRKPIEKGVSSERREILQKRIQPFLLRRTKQEVVLELPPKTETTVSIILTKQQQDLYEAVRLTMMKKVLEQVDEKGLGRSHIAILDALLKLRQICCDPRLTSAGKTASAEDSAKLLWLREMLPQMVQEQRQILLFSQFTSMLALLEEELRHLHLPYALLTGDTGDRATPVQQFQSGEVPIFLLSLKAGGTGLNLTAADVVIHYDPWWNPAVECQATDRAHRIGQTKPVFVYKLVSAGAVEEKIIDLQQRKKSLADALFSASTSTPLAINKEDLETLFAPIVAPQS